MLLRKGEKIGDVPGAISKRMMQIILDGPQNTEILVKRIANKEKTSVQQVLSWLETLQNKGYIVGGEYLELTDDGQRLRLARIGKPMTRMEADKLLNNVRLGALKVNAEEYSPYSIKSLLVFGSYLSDVDSLGDLDIAIDLNKNQIIFDAYSGDSSIRSVAQERLEKFFTEQHIPKYESHGYFVWMNRSLAYVKHMLGCKDKRLSLHDVSDIFDMKCPYINIEL